MNRGDVVIVVFPHASQTPPKRRPGVVIQADYYNRRISNILVVSVTSNLARANDPAHFFVDVSTPEGKLSGLSQDSLVSCLNIATVAANAVGPKIGELSPRMMNQIDACLKAALGIK